MQCAKPWIKVKREGPPMSVRSGPRTIQYAAVTHKGLVRERNEDAVLAAETILKGNNASHSGAVFGIGRPVFMIADGMGGHARGEVASSCALECLKGDIDRFEDTDWGARILHADHEIFNLMERRPELTGMGTTLVGVEVGRSSLVVFNVGDSRAYRFGHGKLMQATVDDVPERFDQAFRSHQITQALGGRPTPGRLFPHVLAQAPLLDDEKLLLCSDGLWDMLPDTTIHRILQEEVDVQAAANALLQAALEAGGEDNVSVIVVGFGSG
ncbi:PP2C family protein-serine/threonine phosphatase [Rhizobium mesoamericanum]|uniref:PP2C family protein-serine/threonine phosphatase n=1 Tax=Rhizobium mesoamericanum TaxID=1079800 RepID=UPI0027D83333|nr:protein phosphatase 2C domain-containing protein [Rhizobium mesoamericanum]